MARIALFHALVSIASASLVLVGCGAQPGSGDLPGEQSGAFQLKPCAPGDTSCTSTPPCDPKDPSCNTDPPVCDPNTDPKCPCPSSNPTCHEGPCDPSSSAGCGVGGGGNLDCADTAKTLAELLAQAQACNPAAAGPKAQCASLVPTTDGCEQPVADANAGVILKYLELWKLYASSCPLPVPACPDPKTLVTDCVVGSAGGLVGTCAIVDGAKLPAGV